MTDDETIRLRREAGDTTGQTPRETKRPFGARRTTANLTPGAAQRPVTPFAAAPAPSARPQMPAIVPPLPPVAVPVRITPILPKADEVTVRPAQPVPAKRGSTIGVWCRGGSLSAEEGHPPSMNADGADTAFAFSNAAAGHSEPVEENPIAVREQPTERPRVELVELIGFHAAVMPRMRKFAAWKKLIADVHPKHVVRDDEDARDKRAESLEKRDALTILMYGESTDARGLGNTVYEASRNLAPTPLGLVSGEIEFSFDEMETLRATLAVIAPFVPGDKKLKETVDVVREIMVTPGIERARSVTQNLCARVCEAFGVAGRGVTSSYIATQTEPMLLEGRCYQKRTVMGQEWIRAAFTIAMDDKKTVLPAYIPTEWANELPLFRRFSAKMIVEARPRVEQGEAAELALKVVALGRKMRMLTAG